MAGSTMIGWNRKAVEGGIGAATQITNTKYILGVDLVLVLIWAP
jgi:hypothetical protein